MTDYITRAKKLLLDGQFDVALELINITENDNAKSVRNGFEHHDLKMQVMIRMGEYEQSLGVIESILNHYPEESLNYFDLLIHKIEATWRLGKLESALEFVQEAEKLLQEIQTSESENFKRKASMYYHLGVIYRNYGDLDKSLSYAKQCLILQQSHSLIHESAITLNLLGIIYFQKGEYDRSLECYTKSLAINDEIGDIQYIAKNFNNLGEIYRFKGDLVKSLNYYHGAHTQFLTLGNKQDILHTSHNIGLILQARGDYEGAKQKLLLSLELNKPLCNDLDRSDSIFHLISVLIDLGEHELAKVYSVELTNLMQSHPQNKIISLRSVIASSLILTISNQKEDFDEAKKLLEEIAEEEIVYHELTVTALIHLCQLLADELIRKQEVDVLSDLNSYIDQLQSMVEDHHSNILTIEIYILQSRFAIIQGKLQRALRSLEQAQAIAQKQNLNTLAVRLEEEIFNFHAEYEKWVSLMQNNIPMAERLEYARITDYVKEAQKLIHLLN